MQSILGQSVGQGRKLSPSGDDTFDRVQEYLYIISELTDIGNVIHTIVETVKTIQIFRGDKIAKISRSQEGVG